MSTLQLFESDFDKADTDKSGSLSLDEVEKILRKNGFNGTSQDAQNIFRCFDKDGNQSVSRAEFSEGIKTLPQMDNLEFFLRKTFKSLDKDGSGSLTLDEIKVASKTPNLPMDISNSKAFQLLCSHAQDADQKMSYEEFLANFKTECVCNEMTRIFNRIDTNKNGFLSKEEMMEALKSDVELKTTHDKIVKMLDSLKTDADGRISFHEFIKHWSTTK